MSINNKLIPVPFAVNAGDTYKYLIPQTNTTTYPNKATYETGFPAVTMADIAAGGVPPFGQDFNGILNDITTAIRYIQSGNYQTYDSAFATSIGGYDKGSVILGNDGKLYQSTVNANKTNPVGGSGWTGFMEGKYLPLSGGTLTGELTGTDITAKTSLTVGSAKATYSTTGLNFNKPLLIGNVAALKQGDGGLYSKSPLLASGTDLSSDLVTGSNQMFTLSGKYTGTPDDNTTWGGVLEVRRRLYDASTACILTIKYNNTTYEKEGNKTSNVWVWGTWKETITTANINAYQSGLGINQTWQDVASSRAVGTVYTNTTGKPIVVNVSLQGDHSTFIGKVSEVVVFQAKVDIWNTLSFSFIVPIGSTYLVSGGNISKWAELR